MKLISDILLHQYIENFPQGLEEKFHALHYAEISNDSFSFYTSVASVFSSKIEGEEIELDSYIKHKRFGIEFLPDYTKKIDDLYSAYIFAKTNSLNKTSISKVHQLLAKNFVAENQQGKNRIHNMYVASDDGKIEYVAISPYQLESEMNKFYDDLNELLIKNLNFKEILYYASMIHLVFVKIHPWNDGNGRSARLMEKWFISEKLGAQAWYIQSEKNYYQNHQLYYKNLRVLGLEYELLNYIKALTFLQMLPQSLLL